MGYNTAILILNDHLHVLESHPEQFVEKLSRQISKQEEDSISVGNVANPVQVMKTEHADVFRLYSSYGNSMTDLSPYNYKLIDECKNNPFIKMIILGQIKQAKKQLKDLEKELKK